MSTENKKSKIMGPMVLKGNHGYYIGCTQWDTELQYDIPYSRDSVEYYDTYDAARCALENKTYTVRI